MAVTITTNPSSARGIVGLLIENTGGSPVTVTVQRSVSVAGSVLVRGLEDVVLAAGATKAGVDGEAPIGTAYVYQVLDSTGAVVATSGSITLAAPPAVDGKRSLAVLRHLTDTRLSAPVLIANLAELTRAAQSETFLAMGSSLPIVSTMPRQGRAGTLQLASLSDEHTQALVDLLADGTILQLVTVPGCGVEKNGIFMHVGDVTESRFNAEYEGEEARIFDLPFVEVQTPSTSAPAASAYPWSDVIADYTDWTDLLATGPATWGDLLLSLGE